MKHLRVVFRVEPTMIPAIKSLGFTLFGSGQLLECRAVMGRGQSRMVVTRRQRGLGARRITVIVRFILGGQPTELITWKGRRQR